MLTPERAKEALRAVRVEDWAARREAEVARLPAAPQRVAQALLRSALPGRGSDTQTQEIEAADGLSARHRKAVFEAVFPSLGAHLERAWQLKTRLTYQQGWERKAFRAPNAPAASLPARVSWIMDMARALQGYEQDVRWLAAWAPHIGMYGADDAVGVLLAAAIESGGADGDAVFEILVASAKGEHPVGAMGRHVTRGLLCASRPAGWELVERLLLAAQREEGLRQVILETVDEAHPEAFRRMLRLIREHDLARFSAVVRALDVWFGFGWEAGQAGPVNRVLEQVTRFLDEPDARRQALASGSGEAAYLALWTLAFEDAAATVEPARRLLADPDVERRFAAAHLLAQLGLNWSEQALVPALDDADLRVCCRALAASARLPDTASDLPKSDLYDRLERLLARLPREKTTLQALIWPWNVLTADRKVAAGALVGALGSRPLARLAPHIPAMDPQDRLRLVRKLAEHEKPDAATRDILFTLVGDASGSVRERAVEALGRGTITEDEAARIEPLLSRKAGDLRRGVLSLLLTQPDAATFAGADRLLACQDALPRLAGLELLRQMMDAGRAEGECRRRAREYQPAAGVASGEEQTHLDVLLGEQRETPSLENALGLMDPLARTRPVPPLRRDVLLATRAAAACLQSLDEWIHANRERPLVAKIWEGSQEFLLGDFRWFPDPDASLPPEEDAARLPLPDLWEQWWRERPAALRDPDGFELLRAWAACHALHHPYPGAMAHSGDTGGWQSTLRRTLFGDAAGRELRYPQQVQGVLPWLARFHPPAGAPGFLLDAVETSFALVPPEEVRRVPPEEPEHWRGLDLGWRSSGEPPLAYLHVARSHRRQCPDAWAAEHHVRLWPLLRWLDEPLDETQPGGEAPAPRPAGFLGKVRAALGASAAAAPAGRLPRCRPGLDELLVACQAGGANEDDLVDHLLGPREGGYGWGQFDGLRRLSGRKPPPELERYPFLGAVLERCRKRIIQVELGRGDTPTAASQPALALRSAGGLDSLVPVLAALGRDTFVRGWSQDTLGKAAVLSHLVRCTFPTDTDTYQAFAAAVAEARTSQERLVELAVYAPQWAGHVEWVVGWPSLASAVWWIHAHTKDASWAVDEEIREAWNAEVSEYTALTGAELVEGMVDVAWFHRVYDALGPQRWQALDEAARFASGGGGHTRARLFASAMLSTVERAALVARLTEKRHQDSARALGLLPLPEGPEREEDLLARYRVLQEFVGTSRQFGSQRQESEKKAARVGMQNLARTAGYPDPIRLEWAMEARGIADLADGPLTVAAGEVRVSLEIDAMGQPQTTVMQGERVLKAIPAGAKKHPEVAALRARAVELKRQAARMRQSLEGAMCRGDASTGSELRELMAHPILAPMLGRLVLAGEGRIGYPVAGGRALRDWQGEETPVPESAALRVAHPHDILATGRWPEWQRECFLSERAQPFKQVFRELYVVTQSEREETERHSRRYAGHQVNTRQALALLGARGWVNHPEEGVRRTFHELGITAWVTFLQGTFTPAEVEGLTLEGVLFTPAGALGPLALDAVPPRVFSEAMRDLDLVVSVAHRGGVDPEASASTVEMRAALLQCTVAVLKLANVRIEGRHALIHGALGDYTIHLGSAVVHKQPGGHLCIVPVHAQHRGRIFLPFADDDPRTAEVMSKVLLLAKDGEIKDPSILEQIRGM